MHGFPLAWLLTTAAFALSGCVGGLDAHASTCPAVEPAVDTASGTYGVLLPAALHDASADSLGRRARVSVQALEGQTLTVTASFVPSGGQARVAFDPPSDGVATETLYGYQWTGKVPAGTYALEVEGDPVAYQAVVSLTMVASGCPTA